MLKAGGRRKKTQEIGFEESYEGRFWTKEFQEGRQISLTKICVRSPGVQGSIKLGSEKEAITGRGGLSRKREKTDQARAAPPSKSFKEQQHIRPGGKKGKAKWESTRKEELP